MVSKILILAGDTDGNLGDLAIVTATCACLRRNHPDVKISLVTSNPVRDQSRLGISPIRRGVRGLPALLATARDADLVICGGGGLFQDDDSLAKMPYWALRLLLVRAFSRPIAGLSIGAGPLDHGISRFFARLALRTLDPISVRDALAAATLAPLTNQSVDVVPDPAFLLEPARQETARQALNDAGVPLDCTPLIGVAVRRWFHTRSNVIPHKYAVRLGLDRRRGRREMSAFIKNVAASLDRVAGQTGAHIVFMPTYNVGHENDLGVSEAIGIAMESRRHSILMLDDPALYKAVTGLLSVMLCGRMHPAILAAAQGTPVVGLRYNQKFAGTFALLDQPERCLAMTDLLDAGSIAKLSGLLEGAIVNPAAHRAQTIELEATARQFMARIGVSTENIGRLA